MPVENRPSLHSKNSSVARFVKRAASKKDFCRAKLFLQTIKCVMGTKGLSRHIEIACRSWNRPGKVPLRAGAEAAGGIQPKTAGRDRPSKADLTGGCTRNQQPWRWLRR